MQEARERRLAQEAVARERRAREERLQAQTAAIAAVVGAAAPQDSPSPPASFVYQAAVPSAQHAEPAAGTFSYTQLTVRLLVRPRERPRKRVPGHRPSYFRVSKARRPAERRTCL